MLLSGVRYHSNLKITVRRSFDQHAHVWSALHCSKRNKCQESSVSNAPVNAQSKFDMLCQLIVSQHQTMECLQIHVLVCLDCCGSTFKCRHTLHRLTASQCCWHCQSVWWTQSCRSRNLSVLHSTFLQSVWRASRRHCRSRVAYHCSWMLLCTEVSSTLQFFWFILSLSWQKPSDN